MDFEGQKFELDVARRELRVGGRQVKIQPKVFKLLQYLVERPERAVSKHELMEELWPGLHVSETALTRCVMKARRAIGDKDTAASVIQTVHGHGYRFVPAKGIGVASEPTIENSEPVAKETQKRSRTRHWVFILPVLVSALILIFYVFERVMPSSDDGPPSIMKLTILPVENATGREDLQWIELGLMSLVHEKIVRTPGMASVSPETILPIIRNAKERPEALLMLDPNVVKLIAQLENSRIVVSARLITDGDGFGLQYLIYEDGIPGQITVLAGGQPTSLGQSLANILLSEFRSIPQNSITEARMSENPLVLEAYAKGKMKLFEGDPEAAREFFVSGLDLEPNNFWLRHETAITFRLESRYEEAVDILEPLLEHEQASDHGQAMIYSSLGFIEYKKGNSAEAIHNYEKFLQLAENHGDSQLVASALVALGSVAVYDEDYGKAREYYDHAIDLSRKEETEHLPESMLHALGVLEARQHNFVAAEKYFEANLLRDRLTNDRVSMRVILGNLARLRHETGDFKGSTEYYSEALALSREQGSDNAIAFNLLRFASLLIDLGRSDEAFEMLSEAIAFGEKSESKWILDLSLFHRARIFRANGQIEAAYADHVKRLAETVSLKTPRKVRSAELDIANVNVDLGRADQARETAVRIVKASRTEDDKASHVKGLFVLGRALIALNDLVAATDAFETALKIAEDENFKLETGEVLCELGNLRFDLGQVAASDRYLEKTRAMFPEHQCVLALTARHNTRDEITR